MNNDTIICELEAALRDAEKATANALVSENFETWTNARNDEIAIRRTLEIMRGRSKNGLIAACNDELTDRLRMIRANESKL